LKQCGSTTLHKRANFAKRRDDYYVIIMDWREDNHRRGVTGYLLKGGNMRRGAIKGEGYRQKHCS
jgi:hypothetical protein